MSLQRMIAPRTLATAIELPEPASGTLTDTDTDTDTDLMKILYVSQYFPPEMGAPAARAAELSRHWARMGHDVTVLTGFPNHPTGVVPEEWRSRFHQLRHTETVDGVRVVRTWLWPLPNRKAHERIRNYA